MNYEDMDKEKLIEILRYKDNLLKKLHLEKEKLKYYASIDAMTGALNRRSGLKRLHKEFDLSKVSNEKAVVCFADVDKLKMINDNFGHEEGDKALITISKILREGIRKTDFVIRMGGDEFLVVFPRTTIKDVNKVCCRINKRIEEFNKNNRNYNLNLSYGFYEYNPKIQKEMSIRDLIKNADIEMYKKKQKRDEVN